jgi:hypothetical protein
MMRDDLMIIVDPDRADLLPRLHAQFGNVMIILDRRRGERRQANQPIVVDQREGGDRRQPSTRSEELYRTEGYRIVSLVRGDATRSPRAQGGRIRVI